MLSERAPALSEVEEDALTLYWARNWLTGKNLHALEGTAVYERGKELQEMYYGDDDEAEHWDGNQNHSWASREFESTYGRAPKAGDILRYSDLAARHHKLRESIFGELIAAWERRIPEIPCPFKLDGARVLTREVRSASQSEHWRDLFDWDTPENHWRLVLEEATGCVDNHLKDEDIGRIPAVVFLDGDCCKPLVSD
jgi:hypothetical protein